MAANRACGRGERMAPQDRTKGWREGGGEPFPPSWLATNRSEEAPQTTLPKRSPRVVENVANKHLMVFRGKFVLNPRDSKEDCGNKYPNNGNYHLDITRTPAYLSAPTGRLGGAHG